MNAAEARETVRGHEATVRRIADTAPPLPADAVAVLLAARFPVRETAR